MPRPPSVLTLLLALTPPLCVAQQVVGAPASTYLARYHELADVAPANQVIAVHHLVLRRDAGQLTLEDGSLYPLAAVGGHTAGAVFRGTGRFTLAPRVPTEQVELRRFAGDTVLDDSVTEAVLLFADSTIDQLAALTATAGPVPGDVADQVRDAVKTLEGKNEGMIDLGVIGPFLNGERSGMFLARLKLAHHGDALFEIDPTSTESVQLYRPAHRTEFGVHWSLVTEFTPQGAPPDTADEVDRLDVPHYRMDANLKETFSADLDLSATAVVSIRAVQPIGPWLPFELQYKIQVDSGRWSDGSAAETFKAKDSGVLWGGLPGGWRRGIRSR